MLAVAALAGLTWLQRRADALCAKLVTARSALSERTVHEYTILSATDLEAAGEIPERYLVLSVLPGTAAS